MKHLLSAAATSALMAGTAFAGNIQPAPQEPVIAPAPMPVSASPNWTGFYAGGELGYGDVKASYTGASEKGDGFVGGLIAGYDYDLGDWVIGAGLDYDWTDIKVDGFEIDSIWRAKLRGGHKIGNGLLYATAGYTQMKVSGVGTDDGYFVGAGYEHMVMDNMSIGGELLYHEYDKFKSTDTDVEAVTAQVRATFRF